MAQTTLGKNTFTVNPLLGERSFLLQPQIMPVAAECVSLYALFTSSMFELMGGDLDAQIDPKDVLTKSGPLLEKAGPIIDRICKKLPPAELQAVMRALLEGATMDGVMLYTPNGNPIDLMMRGRTLDMWRLLIFAVKTSYPDFFGVFDGLRGSAKAPENSET